MLSRDQVSLRLRSQDTGQEGNRPCHWSTFLNLSHVLDASLPPPASLPVISWSIFNHDNTHCPVKNMRTCQEINPKLLLQILNYKSSQIPSLLRPLLLRMIPLTTLSVTSLDPTLSMSSLVLVSHGPSPPSTGSPRDWPSMSPSEGMMA